MLIDGAETDEAVQGLADALGDAVVWGLPEANRTVLVRPNTRDAWAEIREAADAATDALVICFRGAAVVRAGSLLVLDADDTAAVLPLTDLLQVMARSPAVLRLLILECPDEFPGEIIDLPDNTSLLATRTPGLIVSLADTLRDGAPEASDLLALTDLGYGYTAPGSSRWYTTLETGLAIARNRAHPKWADPPPTHHVTWLHDTPATRDLLKREALAAVLGKRLRQSRAEAPGTSFLIHVDGQWGAGKSTLLNLLAADLGDDFVVVSFNAWRHARVQPTWYPLLTAVRDKVVRSRRWYHCRFLRLRETWMRIRYAGASWVLPMAVTCAVIVGGVLALRASWNPANSGAVVSVVTPALAVAGLVWAASRVASRLLLWDSARGARIFEQSHTDPMGEVAHHFSWLLRHAVKPVVIFVDDLDRCDQSTVVETLDVVQNLIREAPGEGGDSAASFVVTADGAWLRCAFEGHFASFKAAIDEPGRPLGYLFQDKLFQLSVPLRFLSAESQAAYVESLLSAQYDGVPAAGTDDVDTLASWAVVRSRWPGLADELESCPELLDDLRGGTAETADRVSAELCAFLAAVDLTAAEVRECSGDHPPPAPLNTASPTTPAPPP
ncbi:P-loop NTPase fold protein [Phytomonospora sp. NPDC050363]|uniref:KAP family P-loop NTPase fold protein n=1 Tax=Phytomonospora sp. NPDC050363 TaxID=3155642 RepID=UPI0033BFE659